jgi:hypothetical protein
MNWLSVTSMAITHRDFSRGLHQLTRMVTFAGLVISSVWGAWAWYWSQPDPLFRVIEINSSSGRTSSIRRGPRASWLSQVSLGSTRVIRGSDFGGVGRTLMKKPGRDGTV